MAKRKSKGVAVFLAFFTGAFTFLYTYKKDKKKFWILLPLTLILITLWDSPTISGNINEGLKIFYPYRIVWSLFNLGIAIYQGRRDKSFFGDYYKK